MIPNWMDSSFGVISGVLGDFVPGHFHVAPLYGLSVTLDAVGGKGCAGYAIPNPANTSRHYTTATACRDCWALIFALLLYF